MATILSLLFDEQDETAVSAMYQVHDVVLQLKQKPHDGRVYDKDNEALQEHAIAHPDDHYHPSSANGDYVSAFPCVGLVVWQAGFVLADWLLRTKPLGPWNAPVRVLELGCGTGQLGICLALAGADVTLTDLAHITPLTQENVDLNAGCCAITPRVTPFKWGTPVDVIQADKQQQQQQQQQQQEGKSQHQQQEQLEGSLQQQQQQQRVQQPWDVIVAADVLYEPQYYGVLLSSLEQLSPALMASQTTAAGSGTTNFAQQRQQQQQEPADSSGSGGSPPIYICYRVRKYREETFIERAEKSGFTVEAVPITELHADFRCGGYSLICLTRRQRLADHM